MHLRNPTTVFLGSPASEVPCKHLVELAQAEVRANPRASLPMREFSGIRLCDAENGVHRLFKKYQLVPPVKIHDAEMALGRDHRKFPYIKLSSWVQYLLDTDQLHRQFVGVRTFKIMQHVLEEFWGRYRAMDPSYVLFQMADCGEVDLSTCIPFYSHSDEGRSYKHLGLWILSSHGLLGRGTSGYLRCGLDKLRLSESEMGLNFTGRTWATQYIFTSMIKTVYSKYPEAQNEMVSLFTEDVVDLFLNGISSRDRQHRVHMIHMGHKGDLPALVRMMDAKRSFSHVPRGPTSRKACGGICHLCLAGVEQGDDYPESIPFEDMSPQAAWVQTLHLEEAWDNTPNILIGMPLTKEQQFGFFLTDLWHNYHLGVSKHFIGSSFVAVLESNLAVEGLQGSVEKKFEWLTSKYLQFFQSQGRTPYINEISRDTMGFAAGTSCPIARWSKGAASTEMMMFLDSFCKKYIVNKTDDPLLLSIVSFMKMVF